MEPEDPHLVVKCAKSLMTLPYLPHDNILLIKQMISIAVNMSFSDPTVIQAIRKSISVFKELIDIYKQLVRNNQSYFYKLYIFKVENLNLSKSMSDLEVHSYFLKLKNI